MKNKPIYLRTERERQGLTQVQLSDRSGVPQNTISKLETGAIANTTATTLLRLAAGLGVDPRTLRLCPDPREAKAS